MGFSNDDKTLVYSTKSGRMCPDCRKAKKKCVCAKSKSVPTGDGVVRVGRETKGRKGKGVTIVSGVCLAPDALKSLAKELKKRCGTGGTLKQGVIEIQGDQRDILIPILQQKGFTVKKSGG